jgi:formylglycine-generating enzyme required for sulfatase activity
MQRVSTGKSAQSASQAASRSTTKSAGKKKGNKHPMRKIGAGEFVMGSSEQQEDRKGDEVLHDVTITRAFYIGKTEVTQSLYESVMKKNPSKTGTKYWNGKERGECSSYQGASLVGGRLPVMCVSWVDVAKFANALSRLDGLEECYILRGKKVYWPKGLDCKGYRLPTESEWEYAARAGSKGLIWAGTSSKAALCRYGNVADGSAVRTFEGWGSDLSCSDGSPALAPVGSYEPNGFGLYDMSGNVWEWVWDAYGAYPTPSATDPIGAANGKKRVFRGGSWVFKAQNARLASRVQFEPGGRFSDLGFRLVRSVPNSTPTP